MDIHYDEVSQASFSSKKDPNEKSDQNDSSEHQFCSDSMKAREKNKGKHILKILFIIFALVLI